MSFRSGIAVTIILLVVSAAVQARAQGPKPADWPQFRGPNRDGVSRETGLLAEWPAGGPRLLWKVAGLGEGFSAPSVAGGRLYGMGLRGDDEVVWARDAATGEERWVTRIAGATRSIRDTGGYGPRCTPTIDGDWLYAEGIGGEIVCLQVATGELRWHKNLVTDLGGALPNYGYSESLLVDGEKVIVTPGGPGATFAALNKQTGEPIWRSLVNQGDRAAYSSILAAEVDGVRQYIQFLSGGLVGVTAKDGAFLWRYDRPANRQGISCSMPVYADQLVFAASAYGTGGGAARLAGGPDGFTATEVYFNRQFQNHHGGVVLVGDYLYGTGVNSLMCVNFKTGEVVWDERSVGKGSLTCADGRLYLRSERGPVALVEANPEKYVEKGRFDQPDRTASAAWAYPVVAGGRLYLRDQDTLFCYDVKRAP